MPDPSEPPGSSQTLSKLWGVGKDLLVIAVVPLVMWVINLSVQNALRDEHIRGLQGEVSSLREEQKRIDAVKEDLQKANIAMVKLEAKIDMANGRLDEIKSLLR